MAATEKVKQLHEQAGFLADHDLYEFAEIIMNNIRSELKQAGVPLTEQQQAVISTYFKSRG